MNWSRAKTILIVALVIVNLILGGFYITQIQEKQERILSATNAAIEYMEMHGIKVNCAVPTKQQAVTVISLRFKDTALPGGLARTSYEDIPVEVLGIRSSDYIDAIQKKDIKITILPAYTALLQSLESVEKEITDVELIYLVDRTSYIGAGEDTALPYWKLSSDSNSYYYPAFSE